MGYVSFLAPGCDRLPFGQVKRTVIWSACSQMLAAWPPMLDFLWEFSGPLVFCNLREFTLTSLSWTWCCVSQEGPPAAGDAGSMVPSRSLLSSSQEVL